MISFKKDTELFIVDRFDEATDTIAESHTEVFRKGEKVNAEIIAEENDYVQLEFDNGSQAFTVLRDCFDVLPVL